MIEISSQFQRRMRRTLSMGASGYLVAGMATAGLLAANPAQAQSTDTAASDQSSRAGNVENFEDIVVTARRVAENIQKVPIAVTAVSEARLIQQDIRDLTTLQRITPGVTLCCTAWNNSTLTVVRGIQQGAPSYFADIPVASSGYGNFFDVTNVQVLKGPQGTLFGQAAVAGAFLYQPHRPGNEFGGYVSATGGSYDRRTIEGAIDMPLVRDGLQFRLAGISSSRRGYIHDLSNNKYYGNEDYYIVRPSLTIKLGDRFENYSLFQYMNAKTTGQSNGLWVLQDLNFIPSQYNATTYNTQVALNGGNAVAFAALKEELLRRQLALGNYKVLGLSTGCPRSDGVSIPGPASVTSLDYPSRACPGDKHIQKTFINQTSFDISDDWTIKNIFGWNKYSDFNGPLDLEMSPLILQHTGSPLNHRMFSGSATAPIPETHSNETQIIGKFGIIDLQLGMFHIWRDEDQGIVFITAFTTPSATRTDRTSETHAYYGQANIHLDSLIEGLTATLGARYNKDKIHQIATAYDPATLAIRPAATRETRVKFDNVPYTLGLQYQMNPETMFFTTLARSYNAGGLQAVSGFPTFAPAELTNLEVGVKSSFDLAGVRTRFNASVFNGWFNNVQVTQFTLINLPDGSTTFGNVTRNAAKAKIRGFETDLTVLPFAGLELGASAGYLDNKYTRWPSLDPLTLQPIDLSNTRFTRAPKWKIDLRGSYTLPLASDIGEIKLNANFSYVSKIIHQLIPAVRTDPNNPQSGLRCYRERTVANGYPVSLADGARVWLDCKPGNHNVDLSIDWKDFLGKEGLTLTAAVTNLTKNIWTPSQANQDRNGGFTAFQPAVPRMWTIRARYEF